MKAFHLNKQDAKLMGVCAGIADYTRIDANLIRIGVVTATLLGAFPWTILAYGIVAWLAKPKRMGAYRDWEPRHGSVPKVSAYDLRTSMRDIDRRMAEVETYVTTTESSLAREIEQLRQPRVTPAERA